MYHFLLDYVSLSRAQKSSVENRDRTISALNFDIACLKIKMQKCPCAPAAVALAATKLCSIINFYIVIGLIKKSPKYVLCNVYNMCTYLLCLNLIILPIKIDYCSEQNMFSYFLSFVSGLACFQIRWSRALYCPNMSV